MGALRRFVLIFGFCQIFLAAAETCLVELKKEYAEKSLQAGSHFQAAMSKLFSQQSDGPLLAIGAAVQLSNGKRMLSMTDYLGAGHDVALLNLQKSIKPLSITKVLWAGEMEFARSADGTYSVVRSNETSGRVYDHITGNKELPLDGKFEIENKIENLASFVQEAGLGPSFQSVKFDPAKPHFLDIGITIKKGDTLRHSFEGRTSDVALLSSMISRDTDAGKPLANDDITEVTESGILPLIRQMKHIYRERGANFFGNSLDQSVTFLELCQRAQNDFIKNQLPVPADLQKKIQESSKTINQDMQIVGPSVMSLGRISKGAVTNRFVQFSLP